MLTKLSYIKDFVSLHIFMFSQHYKRDLILQLKKFKGELSRYILKK